MRAGIPNTFGSPLFGFPMAFSFPKAFRFEQNGHVRISNG